MFDDAGTRLFACLASADAYDLPRRERALLDAHGAELVSAIGGDAELAHLTRADAPSLVLGIERLHEPARIVTRGERTVAYLPSSIIGELEPRDAKEELRHLADACGAGGGLLVGLDLDKDEARLGAAYADRAGLAASFDLNLLVRINRELGGTFQLDGFEHRARFDRAKGRVEMQLVSKRWQWAAVHGHWFNFAAGEPITTLIATKYTVEWFASVAAAAGWKVERTFADAERRYALVLLTT